ncbi:hypothetical protein HYC85_027470 [Camellia sinensis]|uniref:Uncharacterized protein n=1 Tax=Camellia sinensis TaxID=4442 RepID=A0A7J7G8V3_CAMSI|nr:hypothetical protein HYC85_027470 [Camellia sinensis]
MNESASLFKKIKIKKENNESAGKMGLSLAIVETNRLAIGFKICSDYKTTSLLFQGYTVT